MIEGGWVGEEELGERYVGESREGIGKRRWVLNGIGLR